jgi:hypothetical protein
MRMSRPVVTDVLGAVAPQARAMLETTAAPDTDAVPHFDLFDPSFRFDDRAGFDAREAGW